MTLTDFHIHSDNSPDGENSIIEICESAINKRISVIALTDHCEIDKFYHDRYNIGYKQSFVEAKKAISIFSHQLDVRAGVELGQATVDLETADMVCELPYDVILGSIHSMPGAEDFYFLKYDNIDVKKLFADYLGELKKLTEWGNFNVLAHITYPLRYINGEYGYGLKTEDFGDEFEKIFREIIKRGISLEINTSGLRQKIGTTLPDLFLLKLYKSLGGELITLGSDAHRARDVGLGLTQGIEIAKQAGFDRCCIFKNRKPEFIKF
ncbi:HisJ family histidinol phosphate phosphatase [[Clostridium] cellulosi]|jgi:histidinol phosphate phosphatase HisJ family|uniref:Histidinol-phosphatase n=1 Tax=[Clostridium] cellulosi TaxID=29343 RepID=A0A078KTH0_9FIRM|nr:MAG: PHP domain-containing protein [[Clostridium] cellulosi]CDZ24460.1 HisJ family histidinol phosphate phosphatase [[Clostridium] cellulosi]